MQEVTKISMDGRMNKVCWFSNDLSARENMKTFIVQHRFRCGMVLDEKMRAKADNLIKEGKHHLMFEDGMDIYLIRKDRT